MQLLKMELRGFKSFADKTTLTFDKGITAIVGPNGSGKSNISDAIRWVMGEQNVRQLRGQKSEDIIFSGTEKRRPQGAAEVSLYFDNSGHELDIDFSEVVVTRRIFRSGESEFFINKRPCRLKDIHMLFADTGIGQDSMAVIGQNRVDRILNSKPEERRIIFEEVAGISRYKSRKQEGLRKIEETERNLERIHDMMSVLEEQLVPLSEQAERLKAFRRLDAERVSYEGTLALQELRNSERLLTKAENNRIMAEQERAEATAKLEAAEQERTALLAAMNQENSDLRRLDEETLAVHNELDSLKSRQEAFIMRQKELAASLEQADTEIGEARKKEEQLTNRRDEYQAQLAARRQELTASQQGLSLTEDLFHQAEAKAAAAEHAYAAVQTRNTQRQQDLFVLTRDIEDLRHQLDENREQTQDLTQTQREQEQAAATAETEVNKLQHALEDMTAAFGRQQEAAAAWKAKKEKTGRELAQAEKEYRELRGRAAAINQRCRVLEGMEQEHEGVGRAAKLILKADTPWRKAVCGLVGELCTIPAAYVTALDIALGAAAQYVVTADEKTARAAISYLKDKRGGRTTFLPLDTVRERKRTGDELAAAREKGIIGFANDLITFDRAYERIFSSLLAKTLIAETVDAASQAARKYQHRLRIICLDGTQFNAGGSLTGGSTHNREGSLISRRAALQELKAQARELDDSLQEIRQRGAQLRQEADTAEGQAAAAEAEEQRQQLEQQKLTYELQAVQKSYEQAAASRDQAAAALQALDASRTAIQAALAEKQEAYASRQGGEAVDTTELEAAKTAAEVERERCRKALTERQIALAALQEQVHHSEDQLSQQNERLDEAAADTKRLKQKRHDIGTRQTETESLLQTLTANIAAKEKATAAKDKEKTAFYAAREEHFKKNQKLEKEANDWRAEQERWNQRIHAAEVQQEKYRGEIERSEEHLARQGLTRAEAMERRREGNLRELNEQVQSLREQIAALGQINPNAAEEYGNALEKQSFYQTQCDDLLESRKRLQAVVAEIDEAMAAQFSKAFGEIAAHFQRIFSQLFGGGTARILLTDSHDILNAGVSILIQPPGKKQQQLTLLSGGERALTVIALLLAFLAYHPAPFVLFDEVDAALDEANVVRMARYMKNYSGTTQFIVITHRRKTMEAANTLQGVTMEEKGVSRLLTVKVDEVIEKGS